MVLDVVVGCVQMILPHRLVVSTLLDGFGHQPSTTRMLRTETGLMVSVTLNLVRRNPNVRDVLQSAVARLSFRQPRIAALLFLLDVAVEPINLVGELLVACSHLFRLRCSADECLVWREPKSVDKKQVGRKVLGA